MTQPADSRFTVQGLLIATLSLLVPVLALVWVLSMPQRLGLLIFPEQFAGLMLGLALSVVFARRVHHLPPLHAAIDWALSLASLALGIAVYIRFPVLSEGAVFHKTEALLVGAGAFLLVMEGLRRVVGWALVVITAAAFLYAVFGNLVPAPLTGHRIPFAEVLRFIGTDSTATWGSALQIAAFVVVIFVLFGGFLLAVGGGDFFTQLAMRAAGRGPGNTAKVAVVASALFGSISGSAVSNVMSTGIMTIPMMKKSGFKPEQAGAIEAVASTGGQLAPPVMGAAAFLMAELLRIPYRDILLAALLPALIYYISLYVQIDFISRRDGYGSADDIERKPLGAVLKEGILPLISFVVLIGGIFTLNLRAEVAAIWAIGVIAAVGLIGWATKLISVRISPKELLRIIGATGAATCDVLLVTAAAGIIIGLLTTTGLGFTLSLYLINFGGNSLFALLLLTGLIGIILGLGLPTTGVYLLLASLAAPALEQLGIPRLAAHMFVFYYGMLSMITPPIAMAAFAAASISGGSQFRTGLEAFRFGWIAYFLPFLFIYKPGLLMNGSALQIAYVFASALIALGLIAAGIVGHAKRPLSLPLRAAVTALGLATIAPLDTLSSVHVEYGVSVLGLAAVAFLLLPARAGKTQAA